MTVDVTNNGTNAITNLTIIGLMPAGVEAGSNTPGAGTYDALTDTWTISQLDPAQTISMTLERNNFSYGWSCGEAVSGTLTVSADQSLTFPDGKTWSTTTQCIS
jgi:hypothetical protein